MADPLPRGGQSITRGGVALVSHGDGSIGGGATGIFVRDRRVVRTLSFAVAGLRAELLSVTRSGIGSDVLRYALFGERPDPIALLERHRELGARYVERYEVRSFRETVDIELSIRVEAGGSTVYGLDDDHCSASTEAWLHGALDAGTLTLAQGELAASVRLVVGEPVQLVWSIDLGVEMPQTRARAEFRSDGALLESVLATAQLDLEALHVTEPSTGLPFLAAGSPHFLAVFGRDAIIGNLLSLGSGTESALDTLEVLARHQGSRHDDATLEEPGRIVHELRIGDMGVFGLGPSVPYYGSIDSTPLFVVLLEACWQWGADARRVQSMLPAARRAIEWCRSRFDSRGFVTSIPHSDGISNQAWKDSGDSMVRPDGSVIDGVTAPVEVQGYVHDAFLGLARLEHALGDPAQTDSLRADAERMRQRFESHYLLAGPALVALALDPAGAALDVRASNAGHLLATSIIDDDLALRLADRLLSAADFSGWGIRTLASSERAFNPLGYHLGTVWPHDNAVILRGLTRRGFDAHARRLIDALLDLAEAGGGQLPELVGGFDRGEVPVPVPYLASARPQAWAAAVPLQIASSLLGLEVDAPRARLSFRPILREDEHLAIDDFTVAGRTISVEAVGRKITLSGDLDGLDVVIAD